MKTPLFHTQEVDVTRHLATEDLPNYSLPGTGKTLTTIGALEAGRFQSGLVICPVIAGPMWAEVIAHELGAKVQLLKNGSTAIDRTADFIVTTYGLATTQHSALMVGRFDALILDESHNLSSPDAKRTIAVFGPESDGQGGLFSQSRYCFTLTGTPIVRYNDGMWSQLRAIQPDLLLKHGVLEYNQFLNKFTYSKLKKFHPRMQPTMTVIDSRNSQLLHEMLYSDLKAIRRTNADVAPFMPPIAFRKIGVSYTHSAELNQLLKHKNAADIEALLESGDLAVASARRLLGVAKTDYVAEYALEQAANHSVFVGYYHNEVGQKLQTAIRHAGVTCERIGGDTPIMDRDKIKNNFNRGATRVVLGQIVAAGVSLNVQDNCNHVVMAEMDWAPSKVEQFFKRVWRVGQQKPVQVDYCLTDNIVDTALMGVLKRKQARQNTAHGEDWGYGFGL